MRGEFRTCQPAVDPDSGAGRPEPAASAGLRAEMEQRNAQTAATGHAAHAGRWRHDAARSAAPAATRDLTQLLSLGAQPVRAAQLRDRAFGLRGSAAHCTRIGSGSRRAVLFSASAYDRGRERSPQADAPFNAVVAKYPQSPRAPTRAVQAGASQAKRGKHAEARIFMERVKREYPRVRRGRARRRLARDQSVAGAAQVQSMAASNQAEMPFLDHLEELRWRILWSLLALVIGVVVSRSSSCSSTTSSGFSRAPILPYLADGKLDLHAPGGRVQDRHERVRLRSASFSPPRSSCISSGRSSSPALHKHEKSVVIPVLIFGAILFLGGSRSRSS